MFIYATKALRRFANLVMRRHQQSTVEDIEAEIGEAVDFVIHIERQPDDAPSAKWLGLTAMTAGPRDLFANRSSRLKMELAHDLT